MNRYNTLSRHDLIKEIRNGIFTVIHEELTALAKDIQNSDSLHDADKQRIGINDSSNLSKSIKSESCHVSNDYKRKKHHKKPYGNLADLKKFNKSFIETDNMKDESPDSDASNDSSIVLSNLKTLVSSKKSNYKSAGVKRIKPKTKSRSRFLKTHPNYLENVDSVVQDDLYEAIVTTQFKKRKFKVNKDEVEYVCNICDYASKSKRLMRKHKSEHKYESHNGEPLASDILGINKLVTHNKIKIPLFCESCNFTTRKRKLMKSHNKLHKNVSIKREYELNECNMESIPLSQLNQEPAIDEGYVCHDDLKIQKERIPYSCDQCSYQCNALSKLSSHKIIHSAYTQFACGQCDFTCVSRNGLMTHKKSHAK